MALSAAYLYGRRAIDVFVCGICAANALIMLMEVPAFGVGPGLKSLLDNLLSLGGNTYGYAAQLEIHEITFLYALFIVYYVFYADRRTPRQRRRNRVLICLSMLFFLSGMKRIMLPALAVSLLYVWLVRKPSHPGRAAIATGIVWFLFFFVYLYAVYTGQLAALRAQYGLQDRLVIGSVARFMPQKNHRRMLQFFARLQAIQPQSSLALIGEGPLMESCRQQARQLGIAANVLFLGALGDPSGWYQAMDALLMPSLYEGLPTVGIEAQAAGRKRRIHRDGPCAAARGGLLPSEAVQTAVSSIRHSLFCDPPAVSPQPD